MSALIIIKAFGLVGVFLAIFAESGLFFGFFLPGDSLLFIAGLLAVSGAFNIYLLVIFCALAAIAGDSVGYYMGKRFGRKFFERDTRFLKKKYIHEAEIFYKKHGAYTLILGRFVPVIRTFVPIVAGIGDMEYLKFLSYNIVGGVLWTVLLTLLGYFLGNLIPNPDKYILPIVGGIIVLSFVPVIYKFGKLKLS